MVGQGREREMILVVQERPWNSLKQFLQTTASLLKMVQIDKKKMTFVSSNWIVSPIILESNKIWKNRSSRNSSSNRSYLVMCSLTNIIDGGYSNTVMSTNGRREGDNHVSLNDI